MPRFAANLSMLYTELDFLDRFAAAARDGFQAVEFLFPYAFAPAVLASRLQQSRLQQVLFNAPPGDWDAGERGLACLPGREEEFRAGIEQALVYAQRLGCPCVHVMAGVKPTGSDPSELRDRYVQNLRWAGSQAAGQGVKLLIEPINARDMPGYFLNRQDQAHALLDAIGSEHVQVQMDLYHAQVAEGDLSAKLRRYLPSGRIAHIQIAGVPERHEPDVGELNFDYLFRLIDELGYSGWIGCEYRPAAATSPGLAWLQPWL